MIAAALTFREALEVGQTGLIPSPHVDRDRDASPIATVLGITGSVLIARFAICRGQFQPRPSRGIPAAKVVWSSR